MFGGGISRDVYLCRDLGFNNEIKSRIDMSCIIYFLFVFTALCANPSLISLFLKPSSMMVEGGDSQWSEEDCMGTVPGAGDGEVSLALGLNQGFRCN